jgi:hypothetical protein
VNAHIITDRKSWNDLVEKYRGCDHTSTYECGALTQELHSGKSCISDTDEEVQLCAAMLLLISELPPLHISYSYAPRVSGDPDLPASTVL